MKKFLLLIPVLSLLISCESGMQVTSDYDHEVNFEEYKTFQLLPWSEELDGIVRISSRQLVQESIIKEMTSKGYTYVEEGGDLVISIFVHVDEKTGTTAYNTYYGGYGGYGYYGGFGYGTGYGTTTYQNYTYQVGSLIIDFYDQNERKLVWQGIGSERMSENSKKVQNKINSYVRQVLYDFPRKGGKKR